VISDFLRRFWQPPRLHGEASTSREVSFLELFYDLVFVVVIARAAHHLAVHPDWDTTWQFGLILTLVWLAWLNGSLYYELHSKDDGHTRTLIFIEMGILALLAVYTGGAVHETPTGFALTYAAFLLFTSWHWLWIAKHDAPGYRRNSLITVGALVAGAVLMVASIFVGDTARLALWATYAVVLLVGASLSFVRPSRGTRPSMVSSPSLVERFGLFVIIVLGEVVAGMVNGLAETEHHTVLTIGTGMVAIAVGFAIWWIYFDLAGRQLPHNTMQSIGAYMYLHLPISVAIAAVGAAVVSLVAHAQDDHTPAGTAWLLTGAFALFLVTMSLLVRTLERFRENRAQFKTVIALLLGAALVMLLLGWWAPAPWLLALLVVLAGSVPWFAAAVRWAFLPSEHDAASRGAHTEVA
jgi:low temperature requirement protein LtrA